MSRRSHPRPAAPLLCRGAVLTALRGSAGAERERQREARAHVRIYKGEQAARARVNVCAHDPVLLLTGQKNRVFDRLNYLFFGGLKIRSVRT